MNFFRVLLIGAILNCFSSNSSLFSQTGNYSRDQQYFFSDHFGSLDSNFSSVRNTSTTFLLDSTHSALTKNLKIKGATSWYSSRIFNDHLFQYTTKQFDLAFDTYANLALGKNTVNNNNTWSNKRGILFNGTFGKRIKIHSFINEGSYKPDDFISNFINSNRVAPGEGSVRFINDYYDNMISFGGIDIKLNPFMNVSLGHGKNFIGEGYRSLFLSDASGNNPYARLDLNIGQIAKYTAIVGEYIHLDPTDSPEGDGLKQKKYGSFHHVETKLWNRLFIGFFEGVIWAGDSLNRSNFDINYLNPFVVMRPIEFGLGSPDNMMLGSQIKYIPTSFITLYGQFLLTELKVSEFFGGNNWFGNKYGYQIGSKFHNFSFAKNLYAQIEYNVVRPFTYNHRDGITGISHMGQSLGHASGSNLKELVFIANYRYKRWSTNFKSVYKLSGLEKSDSTSVGSDVLRSYNLRESNYGNVIGQGIPYQQFHNSFTIAYLLNSTSLTFVEAGLINRHQIIDNTAINSNNIYVGIRTGISNFYHDF